jgi:hypothetical protein
VAALLVGIVVIAAVVVLTPKVVTIGEPALDTPGAPRVSETAGTMLRVSWRPVMFSDFYELTVGTGPDAEKLRVEGTEVQVPNLQAGTDYDVRVRPSSSRRATIRSAANRRRRRRPAPRAAAGPRCWCRRTRR